MRNLLANRSDFGIGILVALGVTLIINLPLWHALVFTDEASRPDIVTESSDEDFYLTRIRETADGHPWAGHPYLLERSNQRYPISSLFEATLGTAMRVFHLELKTVSIAADAVFPFLLALILWMAGKPVLEDKRWRILLISILFLGFELLWWKRPISPQATTILPLLYLWAALSHSRNTTKFTAARSALIGLMLYSYPFHWTYCLAAESLLTIVLLVHDADWRARRKRILAAALPFTAIAIPWAMMMLSMSGNPDYTGVLARLGLLERRFPAGLPLQALLLLGGLLTWQARRKSTDKHMADTLLALLAAGLAVLNQPLITGREGEFSSHYRVILVFPLWISILWAVRTMIGIRWKIALLMPIAGLVIIGIQTIQATSLQWIAFEGRRLMTTQREDMMAVMEALSSIPRQQVILAEDPVGRALTIYTQHYPFYVFETHMYMMDEETLWERFAVQRALFPSHAYSPRAVVGSSYLNQALYERTLCKLYSVIQQSDASCAISADAFLPERWKARENNAPLAAAIKTTLEKSHVTYALMHNPPRWLIDQSAEQSTIGNYTLLRLDWSKPLPKRE